MRSTWRLLASRKCQVVVGSMSCNALTLCHDMNTTLQEATVLEKLDAMLPQYLATALIVVPFAIGLLIAWIRDEVKRRHE